MEKVKADLRICKWCEHCLVVDEEENEGICYLEIGEHVSLEQKACASYAYDSDLGRC